MDLNWKTLPDYSRYAISSWGSIFDRKLDKLINQQINDDGYCKVTLRSDDNKRKTFSVHRLVAIAFIDNPDNKETVNHKDGDKQNNIVPNLEWATRSEQVQHAWDNALIADLPKRKRATISALGKPVICVTTGEIFESIGQAAEAKNLKKSNISKVCYNAKGYKSAGISEDGIKLIWRFYERD